MLSVPIWQLGVNYSEEEGIAFAKATAIEEEGIRQEGRGHLIPYPRLPPVCRPGKLSGYARTSSLLAQQDLQDGCRCFRNLGSRGEDAGHAFFVEEIIVLVGDHPAHDDQDIVPPEFL